MGLPSPYGRFDHRRGQGKPSPYKFGCGPAALRYLLMSGQTWIKPVPVGPAEQGEPTGGQLRAIQQQGGPGQRFDYDEFSNTQQLSSQ